MNYRAGIIGTEDGSGHSTGEVSFAKLLSGERQTGLGTHLTFDELLRRIVIGGWLEIVDYDEADVRAWLRGCLDQIVEADIPLMGHRRNRATLPDSSPPSRATSASPSAV